MGHWYLNAQVGALVSSTSPCRHTSACAGWRGPAERARVDEHPSVTVLFEMAHRCALLGGKLRDAGSSGSCTKETLEGLSFGVMPASRAQRPSLWLLRKIQIPLEGDFSEIVVNEDFSCLVSLWFIWLSVWRVVRVVFLVAWVLLVFGHHFSVGFGS